MLRTGLFKCVRSRGPRKSKLKWRLVTSKSRLIDLTGNRRNKSRSTSILGATGSANSKTRLI